MKKCAFLPILAVCVSFLLICIVCLLMSVPDSYYFFVDRWASDPDWSSEGDLAFTCHYPSLSQVWKDRGEKLSHWGYIYEGTEICTIREDGSNLVRLTNNQVGDRHPAWSPDGQLIAYLSGSGLGQVIRIIRKDGSLLREFAGDIDIWSEKPAWSPSGESVCFAASDPLQPDQGVNVYVAVVESGEVYSLTTLPGDELECHWSPNGNQLALIWFPEGFKLGGTDSAFIQIFSVNGSSSVMLVEGFAGIGDLNWSPDGTQLAFWAYRSKECRWDCTEVYVVDLSGDLIQCLTERYEIDVWFEVAWSPGGGRIAFTAQSSEGPGIYSVAPSGNGLSRIACSEMFDSDLIWSPTEEAITFVRGIEGEKHHIWVAQMETGELRELEIP